MGSKETEGTASAATFQPPLLSENDQAIWGILCDKSRAVAQSDVHKAKTLLSLRKPTQNNFFKRLKSDGVHFDQSFGDQFLLPTLLHCSFFAIRRDLGCGMEIHFSRWHRISICLWESTVLSMFSLAQDRCADHSHIVLKRST